MKKLYVIFLLIAVTMQANAVASILPTDTVTRHITITRTDTVAVLDTVILRRLVERNEIIYRTEKVILADTVGEGNNGFVSKPRETVVSVMESVRNGSAGNTVTEAVQSSGEIPEEPGETVPAGYVFQRIAQPSVAVDLPDKALFRGDTVPMILRSRNLGRFDRGLYNHLFIPKGIWQIGATASYGEITTEDLELLDVLTDIDISGHQFSIRPYFSYFLRNNMSVGMRLGYNSGKASIGSFKVDIDEDMNFNLHDIVYRSESYTAALTFSQYYGIARRGRFGIYNEVELAFSSGNSDFVRPYSGVLKDTHTTTMQAALNFSPGLSVFVMEPVSFHVSFGVFGFKFRHEKQSVDGVEAGSRTTSGANFRFNIFNINFGIAVNL